MQNGNANNTTGFLNLLVLIWGRRKRIVVNCAIAFVVACVIVFSIPKEYTSEVTIAPELNLSESGLSGSLSSLAAMAGIDMAAMSDNEAIYPELYPEIVSSYPFLTDLLSLEVTTKDGELTTDLYQYLTKHQRMPWWASGMKALTGFLKKPDRPAVDDVRKANPKQLSRRQIMMLEGFSKTLHVEMDHKTSLITVGATMQDPLVAATVAESLSEKLQQYMDKYHTAKQRDNVAYLETMKQAAHEKYAETMQAYAHYTDTHYNALLESVKAEQTRLENEMEMAYQMYGQVSTQLESAKAKLQERKPICVVIQPAVVPFKASSPKKMMTAVLFVFLAFFGTVSWIIVKEKLNGYKKERAVGLETVNKN